MTTESAPAGLVYFISGGEGTAVKIGFTTDLRTRLKRLQSASPVHLLVLAKVEGDRALEREYHRRFARYRLHGEWFKLSQPLLAQIREIAGIPECE